MLCGRLFCFGVAAALISSCGGSVQTAKRAISDDLPVMFESDTSVKTSLLSSDHGLVVNAFSIPAKYFRPVTNELRTAVANGEFASESIYLHGVWIEDTIMAPVDAVGVRAKAVVSLTIFSAPPDYEHRVRYLWDSDYNPENFRKRTGEFIYGLELVNDPGRGETGGSRYLAEGTEFGLVFIRCNGSLQNDGSYVLETGGCTASFVANAGYGLSISFPFKLLANWAELIELAASTVIQWEVIVSGD